MQSLSQYYHMARITPKWFDGFTREIGGWEWLLGVLLNSVDVSLAVEEEVRECDTSRWFDSVRLRPSLVFSHSVAPLFG